MSGPGTAAGGRLRLFVGLRVGPAAGARLARLVVHLARADEALRPVPPQDLHLTLQFLGACEASEVDALGAALGRVALRTAPFEVAYRGLGAFPPGHVQRLLWAGAQDRPQGALAVLAREVGVALAPLGHPPDERPWLPHVTLARVGRGRELAASTLRALADAPADYGSEGVSVLNLMVSLADPVGYAYKNLTSHPLVGA